MVFALSSVRNKKSVFKSKKEVNILKGDIITSFKGQIKTSNLFNIPLGTLYQNKNMEFLYSGNNAY